MKSSATSSRAQSLTKDEEEDALRCSLEGGCITAARGNRGVSAGAMAFFSRVEEGATSSGAPAEEESVEGTIRMSSLRSPAVVSTACTAFDADGEGKTIAKDDDEEQAEVVPIRHSDTDRSASRHAFSCFTLQATPSAGINKAPSSEGTEDTTIAETEAEGVKVSS